MRSHLILLSLGLAGTASAAPSEPIYLGLYLQGQRIGYSRTAEAADRLDGRPALRSDSLTVMDAALLGTPVQMRINGTTWTRNGQPARMRFQVSSAGLNQTVLATFRPKDVLVRVDNVGKKTEHVLKRPAGLVVDDPVTALLQGGAPMGAKRTLWVFDPMTVSFIKNEVVLTGTEPFAGRDGTVQARVVEVRDPRMTTKVYLSAKGDLLKATTGMGIEMRPLSRQEALAAPPKDAGPVDLADATLIRPTGQKVEDGRGLTGLELKVTGRSLADVPSDAGQTVSKAADGSWSVRVHPTRFGTGKGQGASAEFLRPSHLIPSDSPKMLNLAKKITAGQTTARGKAAMVHRYVHRRMVPNAGMGVLRNAEEVLARGEGVCRDYAVLTTTLLRSAGVPARLVGGMVLADGAFYYHAWSEAWDGERWVGVDATLPERDLSAGHLKLAQGNVDGAFSFPFLEGTTIEVVGAR